MYNEPLYVNKYKYVCLNMLEYQEQIVEKIFKIKCVNNSVYR